MRTSPRAALDYVYTRYDCQGQVFNIFSVAKLHSYIIFDKYNFTTS